jgi:hypothetical protein
MLGRMEGEPDRRPRIDPVPLLQLHTVQTHLALCTPATDEKRCILLIQAEYVKYIMPLPCFLLGLVCYTRQSKNKFDTDTEYQVDQNANLDK